MRLLKSLQKNQEKALQRNQAQEEIHAYEVVTDPASVKEDREGENDVKLVYSQIDDLSNFEFNKYDQQNIYCIFYYRIQNLQGTSTSISHS